jgi:hypothetical protein
MDIPYLIKQYMQDNSGLDQHRNYLGISKISECPRKVVNEYFHGIEPSEQAYRMCFAGYEQEDSVKKMLLPVLRNEGAVHEVIAGFDSRLRGHTDGETVDGNLLEIKSVSTSKFNKVSQTKRVLQNHYQQIQLYMHFGGWKSAWVVYRCRETYEHIVIKVAYNQNIAMALEEKAKRILRYIDEGTTPPCECGNCR